MWVGEAKWPRNTIRQSLIHNGNNNGCFIIIITNVAAIRMSEKGKCRQINKIYRPTRSTSKFSFFKTQIRRQQTYRKEMRYKLTPDNKEVQLCSECWTRLSTDTRIIFYEVLKILRHDKSVTVRSNADKSVIFKVLPSLKFKFHLTPVSAQFRIWHYFSPPTWWIYSSCSIIFNSI
jgi:hypothetical protein